MVPARRKKAGGARRPAGSSGSSRDGGKARTPRRTIRSREGGERLNRYLAEHGLASRRAADELILAGHVTVDGVKVEELGLRVDPESQAIEVDGARLVPAQRERKRYYLLNKPAGVVCTNDRREMRPKAVDLVTDRDKGRIYTVGRLDEESKGLILLTNDGEFANRIMHPRYGVSKTYLVKLRGRIADEVVQKIREGVHLAEGRTSGARVVVRKRTRDYTHLQVTLREGKNREIRRMFHRVGAPVVDLRRSQIGTLDDRKLKIGFWRPLTKGEVNELLALSAGEAEGDAPPPTPARRRKAARQGKRGTTPGGFGRKTTTRKRTTKRKTTRRGPR